MAKSSFKHFFSPDTLKDISPVYWLQLLSPHRDYVAGRGLTLPVTAKEWEPDLSGARSSVITEAICCGARRVYVVEEPMAAAIGAAQQAGTSYG